MSGGPGGLSWPSWPTERPCVAVLETASIAAGIDALDRMLKEAPVETVAAGPVSAGKWLSVIAGEVDEVRSALRAGVGAAAETVVDSVLIPEVHADVIPAIRGEVRLGELDALGILEAAASPSLVIAADLAAKHAGVRLLRLRLAVGIGGKATLTFTGEVSDVRASMAVAADAVRARDLLVREVVIPQPDPGIEAVLR